MTGSSSAAGDSEALARALLATSCDRVAGAAARAGATGGRKPFSLKRMVADYTALYEHSLAAAGIPLPGGAQSRARPVERAMCGIVGIMDTRARREIARALLARLNESQHHRGPDADGLHCEAGLGLGHKRLSIIDLSTGQQPLYNEDRSVVVVFNGEIYNYQELIPELTRSGIIFRTKSDTEVIVHAWEHGARPA